MPEEMKPLAEQIKSLVGVEVERVNHPPHYNRNPSGVECITVVEHMTFNVGNAMKYLWRSDHKGGVEDLRKALWYIQREIDRLEPRTEGSLREDGRPSEPHPAQCPRGHWAAHRMKGFTNTFLCATCEMEYVVLPDGSTQELWPTDSARVMTRHGEGAE